VSTIDERELVRRCQAGSTTAYEPLVRAHEGPALRLATALLGDADEAADAVQDAFVQAYRSMDRVREGSDFGAWYRTILRRVCLDRLRSPRLRSRRRLEPVVLDQHQWVEATGVGSTERAELERIVGAALQQLPAEQRSVLVLKELEGLGYAEIATALGIPVGTVGSRLNHARRSMRRVLTETGITMEDVA
jgi:RNA polymerase sigma-70 factor, ECF subfamily